MKHLLPSLIILGLLNMGCGKTKKEPPVNSTLEQSDQEKQQPKKVEADKPKKDVAVITTDFGDMVVEFFEGVAPKHVESFKLHAKNGYYNGTLFHRVIPGFMIQGGDPNTKPIIKLAMVRAVMQQSTLVLAMRASRLPGMCLPSSMISVTSVGSCQWHVLIIQIVVEVSFLFVQLMHPT